MPKKPEKTQSPEKAPQSKKQKAPGFYKKKIGEKELEKKYLKFIDQKEDKAFIRSVYGGRDGELAIRGDLEKADVKRLKTLKKAIAKNRKGEVKLVFLVLFGALVAGGVFFFTVLLNPLAEKAFIAGLEAVFEAKVEPVNFRVRLLAMEIGMDGLAIADRDNPLQNLIQFDRISLALKPAAVFRGKIYIEEMAASAIRFGTPREVSGALPDKPAKVKPEKEKAAIPGLVDLGNFDATALLNSELDKLKTPKLYQDLIAAYEASSARWKGQIETGQNRIASLQTRIQPFLSLNINDYSTFDAATLERIRNTVQEIDALLRSIEEAANEVTAIASGVEEDVKTATRLEESARAAFAGDFAYLSSYLDFSSGPVTEILNTVLEEVLTDSAQVYLAYGERGLELLEKVKEFRAKLPKSSKPEKPSGEKFRGRDVVFPVTLYPEFYLETLSTDVYTPGNWHWDFDLSGVSSDPDLSGTPVNLSLSLAESGDPDRGDLNRSAEFSGGADFRSGEERFSARLRGAGFPVSLNDGLAAAGIQGYAGNAAFDVELLGASADGFSGGASISLSRSELSGASNTLARAIDSALRNVASLDIGARFTHEAEGDSFALDTNIGDLVMAAVRETAGLYARQAEAELEKVLREKASEYVDESLVGKEDLDALFALARGDKSAADELKNRLNSKKNEFELRLRSAVEDAANQVKNEAERQAQDAVNDILKGNTPSLELPAIPGNLFGR